MRQIGLDIRQSLLAQEALLASNTLLSGFDLLLKANFFQGKDGYFYSAFFQIAIGMERMLKLAVVTNYMLTNNYQTPTIKQLKKEFGHDIFKLYQEVSKLSSKYMTSNDPIIFENENDESLVKFFSEYGLDTRYFNLNEICESQQNRSPLYKWLDVSRAIYEEYTASNIRERTAMGLIYKMDRVGPSNRFTNELDESGHPLTVFDCLYRQYWIQKSGPLVIWRLVTVLRPIYSLLSAMSLKASEYEVANNISNMVIPHYEDIFYFLLANKQSIKRRKKWLDIFQS